MIGSSKAMPITTAFQLLGASLWGVLYLGNWPGVTAKIIGTLALGLIIVGARMTVWTEEKTQEKKLRQVGDSGPPCAPFGGSVAKGLS